MTNHLTNSRDLHMMNCPTSPDTQDRAVAAAQAPVMVPVPVRARAPALRDQQ